MTRYRYYTATTLDGYLADPDDSLDWLLSQPEAPEPAPDAPHQPAGIPSYKEFIAEIGVLAMGATTYQWVLDHLAAEGEDWPHSPLPPGASAGVQGGIGLSGFGPGREAHAGVKDDARRPKKGVDQRTWRVGAGVQLGIHHTADDQWSLCLQGRQDSRHIRRPGRSVQQVTDDIRVERGSQGRSSLDPASFRTSSIRVTRAPGPLRRRRSSSSLKPSCRVSRMKSSVV